MRHGTKLSTSILISQVAILVVTVSFGFALYAKLSSDQLRSQYEQHALAVAQSVAALPQVQHAVLVGADPDGAAGAVAEQVRRSTNALYVVVLTHDGVRLSHPNPALLGQRIEEPLAVLDGRPAVGVDPGSLGPSANGKAPVVGPGGAVVGEVSAGILMGAVSSEFWREVLPPVVLYTALALVFGAIASLLLARRLKRTTFGLELHEIASLLREREAMLHGVREGVLTFDPEGRVTLVNDEACRLLGLRTSAIGQRLEDVLPPGRLLEVLSGESPGADQVVLTDRHCLVVNQMRVGPKDRPLGSVVTLRNRTETEGLLRELTSARGLTDALRAQQHEYANRMHALTGLLELGEFDEALSYLTDISGAADGFAESVSAKVSTRVVAALIIAKATVAAERGVELLLTEDSRLDRRPPDPHAVVTVLGNLIDNAIDAALLGPPPAHVTLRLVNDDTQLTIRVSDTGPGIRPGDDQAIFCEGFTTKPDRDGAARGLGLALVQQVVARLSGQISVTAGPGPAFTITLPLVALSGATP